MDSNQQTEQTQAEKQRPSSTSPPGGKTHEATTPPGQGDTDQDALEKSREGLERAGGGH